VINVSINGKVHPTICHKCSTSTTSLTSALDVGNAWGRCNFNVMRNLKFPVQCALSNKEMAESGDGCTWDTEPPWRVACCGNWETAGVLGTDVYRLLEFTSSCQFNNCKPPPPFLVCLATKGKAVGPTEMLAPSTGVYGFTNK
jgi:hypothetical protein